MLFVGLEGSIEKFEVRASVLGIFFELQQVGAVVHVCHAHVHGFQVEGTVVAAPHHG